MTPAEAMMLVVAACLAGAPVTWALARSRTAAGWTALAVAAVASGLAWMAAAEVLASGQASGGCVPGLGTRVLLDGLSALFVALIATVAPVAALFSIRYMDHYPDYGVARYYSNFLVFVAGMYGLVVVTDTMWVFMVFWQMMTISSYLLIRFEHRRAAHIRAANKYLLMMQIACVLLMAGSAILAPWGGDPGAHAGGRHDFESLCENVPVVLRTRPVLAAAAFAMFLAGFGIKAGMWPFGQVWLPDAHPAAPSPVSALLSGVMIKTGVYGLVRSFFWMAPLDAGAGFPAGEWGLAILILGTVTLFTGTAAALLQEQSKRLLAFSSIGQVGYILFGLGAALCLFSSGNRPAVALGAAGFAGALFHVVNHGLCKGLLFLNAGSVMRAAGTQNLNRLGGLMRLMPATGVAALVGAFSVSGVPLSNGFASKWSMYVATLQGAGAAWYLAPCAVIAILTSALTLAVFVKFIGTSFLGRASTWVADKAGGRSSLEGGWSMVLPQAMLAGFCVVLGLFPALGFGLVAAAVGREGTAMSGAWAEAFPAQAGGLGGVMCAGGGAVLFPLAVAGVIALGFAVAACISRLGASRRRKAEPWLCGYVSEAECHRYPARGFYGGLRRYLKWVGGSVKTGDGGD